VNDKKQNKPKMQAKKWASTEVSWSKHRPWTNRLKWVF